ncbi:MAG: hypothetical protein CVV44_10255 [Spirochaetae bacterium HGW-Spirochaetae-1]|jgi:hypothetical protein|nr:MAG: hypothetical protein CVV44_10255 [Spirochaetae bacterium HGW-Spirochaetae-1]
MKKLFIILSLFIITLYPLKSFAEEAPIINFGTIILGLGDLASFNNYSGELFENYKNDFNFNQGLSLDAQFIVFKGFAVGGTLNFKYFEYETLLPSFFTATTYQSTAKNFIIGVGPSLFYYYQLKDLIPFLGFQFLYSLKNVKFLENGTESEMVKYNLNLYTYSAIIGLSYMLTKYLAFYCSYSYNRQMSKMTNVKVYGSAPDEMFFYFHDNKDKEIWGDINSLNIGVKIFIN